MLFTACSGLLVPSSSSQPFSYMLSIIHKDPIISHAVISLSPVIISRINGMDSIRSSGSTIMTLRLVIFVQGKVNQIEGRFDYL